MTNPAQPSKKIVWPLLGLMALGLVGNYFVVPIFFGIDFLFGSIFTMLALQFFGLWPGLMAAVVISSGTLLTHQQPLLIALLTLEVVTVGWQQRKGLGLVVADSLYWLCVGIPLTYLFFQGVQQLPAAIVLTNMLEWAINGICNAMLARLLFMLFHSRSRTVFFPLREVMFNLFAFFVLIPALALLAYQSRQDFSGLDKGIRQSLIWSSQSIMDSLNSWLGQKSTRLVHLAWRARQGSPQLQRDLDFLLSLDHDLQAVGIIDKNARSTLFSPQVDALGQSTTGKDFSDRPYLPTLKQSLVPQLSEVLISRIGQPEPITVIMAPIVIDGEYDGYAAALLNLKRVQKILSVHGMTPGLRCTILDRNNKVIASNQAGLQAMASFSRAAGSMTQLADGVKQWQPQASAGRSFLERRQHSFYIDERDIGGLSEWRLVVEQPLGPLLSEFYGQYAKLLAFVFLLLLAAILVAEIFSRKVLSSVVSLQAITRRLPENLTAAGDFTWPTSFVAEVSAVVDSFREMAGLLDQKFQEIRQLNLTLEQRVEEGTRAFVESEEKYHIIFENRMYPIYIFDLESLRLLDINRAFTALYGYSREEAVLGISINDFTAWSEDTDFIVHEAMSKGSIFVPLRYHRKKDGTIFPVELAGGPYFWQGRQVMFVIANDITERQKATEELQARTRQLEALTGNLAGEVEKEIQRRRKNEEILIQQAKLAAMGEMVGAIAHQWRQPLNSLGLCIQNIKDSFRFGDLSQESLDLTIGESMAQINHMSHTIDDFRNFFRPEKDKVCFDTMLAVGEVLTLFAVQLAAHDISFALTCATHQRTFYKVEDIVACSAKITLGYKNEFEHVILNLLNNARDAIFERRRQGAMPKAEPGLITFEFLHTGSEIVIRVSDNGCGIPEHLRERIFEPYFTTKDPDKGTGVGLYLSKIIIEDHMDGRLSVESAERGVTFVLVLPAVEERRDAAQ